MRYAIHYLMAMLLGLAAPPLMAMGASEGLSALTAGGERHGHSTPIEFLALFLGIGVLALGAFLVLAMLSARLLLPKDGKKARHVLLALLLYLLAGLGCVAAILLDG